MLPKVATHILHSTTRAVSSIQHQSYNIRNVLHAQSSSSTNTAVAPWSAPGSSHRGNNNGPGPGSAKYGAGSRFNGYTGAGRAVTQANATISSTDGSFVQSDDQDDVPVRPVPPQSSSSSSSSSSRTRIRSSSLSIPSHTRTERAEKLGVLKTVQLHARAFTSQSVPTPDQPVLRVRRNSTSASPPTESLADSSPPPPPSPPSPPRTSSRRNSVSSTSRPSSSNNPASEKIEVSFFTKRLLEARNSGYSSRAVEAVQHFRQNVVNPSVREFNAALEALQATRRPGEPLSLMLDTYNDMLRRSLLPNVSTYVALIDTLTVRDQEVHDAITILESRIKHRAISGSSEVASDEVDKNRILMLKRENNFVTAMSLFETVLSIGGNRALSAHTYASLLRSCAANSNIDAAIHVFAQQEKRQDLLPSATTFLEMIRAYTNAGHLRGAEEIFAEYRDALKRGDIYLNWAREGANPNRLNNVVWNQMIETYFRFDRADKAIDLVETMMAAKISQHEIIADPPPVSSATFTTVLTGFCRIDDVDTALVWFDRLLSQEASSLDPYEPTGVPMKPDNIAWGVMLDALAIKGMVPDMNRIFAIRLKDSPRRVRNAERLVVYTANMENLKNLDDEQCGLNLDFMVDQVLMGPEIRLKMRVKLTDELCAAYLDRKMYDKALRVFSSFTQDFLRASLSFDARLGDVPPIDDVYDLQHNFITKLNEVSQGNVPYTMYMKLARISSNCHVPQPPSSIPYFLQTYALARASKTLPLSDMGLRDWELLLMAANSFESMSKSQDPPPQANIPDFAFEGLVSLVRDLNTYNVSLRKMNKNLTRQIIFQVTRILGSDETVAYFNELGFNNVISDPELYVAAINQAVEDAASTSDIASSDSGYASETPLKVDSYLSKTLMDEIKNARGSAHDAHVSAYAKLSQAVEEGRAPHVGALSFLIQSFGRMNLVEELNFTYGVAQRVLRGLESNKTVQTSGWFDIENAMIIGLAHHGDVEGAHQYRRRILAHGGAPNADAYGALIYNVKDTTDDASNALALFHESQTLRVHGNSYYYNNIISKLAKARKAEYALELFQQMKARGIVTSSVTFGAIMGACARVGDSHSAELLFKEMINTKNFKPRIPPYNIMMQLYTTTKPDRERALYFYNEMLKVRLSPSAHTYKLLLDAYGSIEPIDLEGMNSILEKLKADELVSMQCTHYASLINAYGCVHKDLDKAIRIFDTMDVERDAIIYEAMINVLVVHRRADLLPVYLNKMELQGIHMTAYVANALIKGHSLLDNIEEARRVFESLEDPPEGVAAPNNHPPHSPSQASPVIDQSTPVYREPSTWEAMIRAELGSGNRDGALALLERLKARKYPEAVFSRISGILVDHSQVPL